MIDLKMAKIKEIDDSKEFEELILEKLKNEIPLINKGELREISERLAVKICDKYILKKR